MSTYKFSQGETYAVYETHGGKCFWCGEPLALIDCTVDHVIPETVEDAVFCDLREHYALNAEFQINNFYNWVPAHLRCNGSKSDRVFGKSHAMIKVFEDLAIAAPKATLLAEKIDGNRPTAKKLATLFTWIANQSLSSDEVKDLTRLIEQFYADVPEEVAPTSEVTLQFMQDVTVQRSRTRTRVIQLGTFIRTGSADARMVIEKLADGEFAVRLGFVDADHFSLKEGGQWQVTGSDVEYLDDTHELLFHVKPSTSGCAHTFHLHGPSPIDEVADSLQPAYKAAIEFHDGAAIITEEAGQGIFSSGWRLAGTYLRGYRMRLETVPDRFDQPAMTNSHPDLDPSWECPHCGGNKWSGAQCRECCRLVDPAN